MKAAYFYAVRDIRVEEVPAPKVGDDEILVKVCASAVCGTDLRIYQYGHFKIKNGEKRVLGHEVAGVISAVGRNVGGFSVGERVATAPNIGCGHCMHCIRGDNQMCREYDAFGINLDGGFAEYMLVNALAISGHNVVRIPENMDYEEAVMAEPLSCCYNSCRALDTKPGDVVLIIGAGPIGALHIAINALAGAARIIVADVSDHRLKGAREYGADIVINSAEEDLAAAVMRYTGGEGADVIIAACSSPDVQAQALTMAAVHGRVNFFGGMPAGKEQVTLNTNLIHYKELKVLGTTGSTINDYLTSMKILASKKINVKPLISKRFSIDETPDAFQYAESGQGMKALVVFD